MKPYVAVFLSVFVAELGDQTQLVTMLFATYAALSRWGVLAAAGGALDGPGRHRRLPGRPAVDLDALADAVSRFSSRVAEVPTLRELEINPLLAMPVGARALDV